MSDFLQEWFQGFEKGIDGLKQEEKEKFFHNCGRKCADTGIIKVYEKLFIDSGKVLDTFFSKLSELESVSGNIVKPGEHYEIAFLHCLCDLHTLGYVHSDYICECSRQSIIYVMKSLVPDMDMKVDKLTTILGGDVECRFSIKIG
ncbi:MAG: hypothetical protein PF505_07970 [Vallitaleaceae bacterium]|jgi:hypothetical protein|nr:hypothetical protein [Vallitaleaceae bacterium]